MYRRYVRKADDINRIKCPSLWRLKVALEKASRTTHINAVGVVGGKLGNCEERRFVSR